MLLDETLLAILGVHVFLSAVFLWLLSMDDQLTRKQKQRQALVSIFIPIVGTIVVSGAFKRRNLRPGKWNSSTDNAIYFPGSLDWGDSSNWSSADWSAGDSGGCDSGGFDAGGDCSS